MLGLISALVYLIFLLSNVITGICLYRLGLHGRILNYTKQMEETSTPVREPVRPSDFVEGQQYNPMTTTYQPRYYHQSHEDEDAEPAEYNEFVDDPVTPDRRGGLA